MAHVSQVKIPATYMRGGTSKGVFFRLQDLPERCQVPGEARDNLFMRVIGSPDPYSAHIDGMGGAAVCADARKCFYVVNPSGDLAHTQATFEAAFRLQPWEGVAGAPPDAQRLLAALRSQDLFAYCGHGAGERYLGGEGGESLRASPLAVSTAAILMGCSSGRLKRVGPLEPRGMALSYLMAGCPLAIGCLWDVSDRDIDRFADFVFRVGGVYVNVPPKMVSDSKGKTSEEACAMTLPLAVARGRESVRMKFLIGAAPVCYGLPVICRWVEEL